MRRHARLAAMLGLAALGASLGALTPGSARAADIVVRASVDREKPHVNESFTYTLRAEGQVRGDPNTAPLEQKFDVLQSTTSTRIQIVNGQAAQVSEWIFQLMPRAAGPVTIPPIEVAGAFSNAVKLDVLPSSDASGAPSDVFMEVEADPTTAYVQSQIVYTMRLFVGIGTGRASITPPEISGGEAIVERLGEDRQYQTSRGGRTFIVHERRYAIFPQKAGMLTVGPATFEAMIMPNRGFSRIQRFRSGTLEIAVNPAVAPPPEFPGAAWLPAKNVTLTESWSEAPEKLAVGVPITRTLTIEAKGLLETQLPPLDVPRTDGIRQYPDQPDLDRESQADGLTARRTERFAVLAQAAGAARLPAVKLPWFDVGAGQWKVAELPARDLVVAPGAPDASAAQAATAPPAPAAATAAAAPERPKKRGIVWPLTSGVLALGWLATAVLWWRARRRRAAAGTQDPVEAAGRDAGARARTQDGRVRKALRAACERNDADAARDLLLEWGAQRFPGAHARSLGALARYCPAALAAAIRGLEADLYGPSPGGWSGAELAAALDARDSAEARDRRGSEDDLLPLYR
ncbi:MAG TPA: BatD family protein [Gammaproteobacteria bacterium]|nr:BatD family protein [Gammaproteobacteria bacterium]